MKGILIFDWVADCISPIDFGCACPKAGSMAKGWVTPFDGNHPNQCGRKVIVYPSRNIDNT